MLALPAPPVEIGIALSVVVLGLCIALAVRAPVWAAAAVVGAFALFHGYAHGRELPSAADPVGYSLGFVLATGLLHVAGIGLGTLKARRGGELLIRALGGAVALAGGGFLVMALTS
jgi:urease accessory protein